MMQIEFVLACFCDHEDCKAWIEEQVSLDWKGDMLQTLQEYMYTEHEWLVESDNTCFCPEHDPTEYED